MKEQFLNSKKTYGSMKWKILFAFVFAAAFFAIAPRSYATTYTWTNGSSTGVWTNAGNWSPSGIPTTTDSVIFSASSTANCSNGVTITNIGNVTITSGYTGTLSTSWGTISGTYSQAAGTSTAAGTATTTIGSSFTLTGGVFTKAATFLSIGGPFSQTGGTFTQGTGNITVGNSLTVSTGTFKSATGTLTVTGSFNFTPASFNSNGGTILLLGSTTSSAINVKNTTILNNLTITPATEASTLNFGTSTIVVTSTLTYSGTSSAAWQGSGTGATINVYGNIVDSNTDTATTSFANGVPNSLVGITINGTSTQTFTGNSAGQGMLPSITINKASGTLSLFGVLNTFDNFTYTTGTVTYGTSTVAFVPYSGLSAMVTGTSTFNNFEILGNYGTGASFNVATGTTVTVNSTSTYGGSNFVAMSGGGTLNLKGDLINNNTASSFSNFSNPLYLTFTGLAVQNIYSSGVSSNQGVLPGIIVNKSGATNGLNLYGIINVAAGWTYITGPVTPGTSTVEFVAPSFPTAAWNATSTGTSTFNNVTIYFPSNIYANSLTIATGTVVTVNGTLDVTDNATWGGGGEIDAKGNVSFHSGGSGASFLSTGKLVMNGTTTQNLYGDPSNAGNSGLPTFVVNKSSGVVLGYQNLTFSNPVTLQSGEFWMPSSTTGASPQITLYNTSGITITSSSVWGVYQPNTVLTNGTTSSIPIANSGIVRFDAYVPNCTSTPDITLSNSSTSGSIQWNGTGTYIMRYLNVNGGQQGSASINAINSNASGTNGSNWSFVNQPAPELIQKVESDTGSVDANLVTYQMPHGVRPGDMMLLAVATAVAQGALNTPTDTASDTYILVTSTAISAYSTYYRLNIYYGFVTSSTVPFKVTFTAPGDPYWTVGMFDYAGITPSSTVDVFNSNINTTYTSNYPNTNTITSNHLNELYFAASTFLNDEGASLGNNPASPWNPEINTNGGYDGENDWNPPLYTDDFVSSNNQSISSTWYITVPEPWEGIIVGFESAYSQTYPQSGSLYSSIFDTQSASGATLNSVQWTGSQPAGTSVGFQFAVSTSSSGPWTYVGPDGTAGTVFTATQGIPVSLTGNPSTYSSAYKIFSGFRYYCYRVILYSDPTYSYTPIVNDIEINWSP